MLRKHSHHCFLAEFSKDDPDFFKEASSYNQLSPHKVMSRSNLHFLYNYNLIIYCDISYSRVGVNQMWILKNSYIQSRSLYSYKIINNFDFNTFYTIPPLKAKWQIRIISSSVLHEKKEWPLCIFCRCKYLVLGRDESNFVKRKKNTTLNLPKISLKLISSKYSSIWLTTYLLCLVDVNINRQSAYM